LNFRVPAILIDEVFASFEQTTQGG